MDSTFCKLKNNAEDCLSSLNNGFSLTKTDEEQRQLSFANESITFYIGCPETEDGNDWSVWSLDENVHPYLPDVIDWVTSSRKKSLADIIEKVCSALAPMLNDNEMDTDDDEKEDDEDDEDLMDDAYYQNEDRDAIYDVAPPIEDNEEDNLLAQYSDGPSVNRLAVNRLARDMKALNSSNGAFGVVGKPQGDNLFLWDVQLTNFDSKSKLGKDLEKFAKTYKREPVVYMELQFPPDYPMSPPFARVTRPRFQFLTGHVTLGGSVCMEMLTKSGWRPTNDIESLLVQIRSEVMSDPNARLDQNPDREYSLEDAKAAFRRTVQRYGWDS